MATLISHPVVSRGKLPRRVLPGFTLVELLVVMAIISILAGLVLGGLQSARTAARRVACMNNHRQLALAVQNFESAHRKLPGPTFNAYPTSPQYKSDIGFFTQLLPYIEEQNRWNNVDTSTTSFDRANEPVYSQSLPILLCPEGDGATVLEGLAEHWGGDIVEDLSASTMDYRANKGYFEPSKAYGLIRGSIPYYVKQSEQFQIAKSSSRDIRDGLSNTLLMWDSIGSKYYFWKGNRLFDSSWEESILFQPIKWVPYLSKGPVFRNVSLEMKGYLYSWAGFGTGTVRPEYPPDTRKTGSYYEHPEFFTRIINGSNQAGRPFSFHPGICPVSFADGHVDTLSERIDVPVMYALVSANGGEVVEDR